MIPLILQTNNEDISQEWIDNYIKKNSYLSYAISLVKPEKTEITINQVRAIKKDLIISTNYKKLFVLYSFDFANIEAQNALLKTLEEKNEQNQFIMVVQNYDRVLPTIRSRSKKIEVISEQQQTGNQEFSAAFETVLEASTYEFMSNPIFQTTTKDQAVIILDQLIFFLRNQMRQANIWPTKVIKKVLELKELLQNNNLNPQLTVDSALMFFKKNTR